MIEGNKSGGAYNGILKKGEGQGKHYKAISVLNVEFVSFVLLWSWCTGFPVVKISTKFTTRCVIFQLYLSLSTNIKPVALVDDRGPANCDR